MPPGVPGRDGVAAPDPSGRLLAAVAALAAAGIAAALVTQHALDMQPCPWCILQRLLFVLIACVAATGAAVRALRLPAALAVDALATAGIAAALYQHLVAAKSVSCNLTLADRIVGATGLDVALPEVFAVRASCADAAVDLLGLPYEFWSLALFALLAGLALTAMLKVLKQRAAALD